MTRPDALRSPDVEIAALAPRRQALPEHNRDRRIDPKAGLVARWMERMKCRRELRRLALFQPDSVLEDAGLTREQVWREARKPFWSP